MFGEIAPRLHGGAPRPMRYVTGPSPAISNCCHHLFIFAFPSRFTPPFILLPVRLPTATAGPGLINVSESRRGRGGDTVAANRFRAGAHNTNTSFGVNPCSISKRNNNSVKAAVVNLVIKYCLSM